MELLGKILLICIVSVAATEALQCFTCQHRKPDLEGQRSPTTCEAGKKPKSAFIEECKALEYRYYPLGSGKFLGVPESSDLKIAGSDNPVSIAQQTRNATYSCYKLTMAGKNVVNGSQSDLAITLRGCLEFVTANDTYPDKCYEGVSSKLISEIEEQELKIMVAASKVLFTEDPNAGICSCNGDECNGAINSVVASLSLILVATVFSLFRKDL